MGFVEARISPPGPIAWFREGFKGQSLQSPMFSLAPSVFRCFVGGWSQAERPCECFRSLNDSEVQVVGGGGAGGILLCPCP